MSGESRGGREAPSKGPETLVDPEPGFLIVGSRSHGRNNTFLREGWRQVDQVFSMPGTGS